MTTPPALRNTLDLDTATLIHHEYQRAARDGVTINTAPEPRDTFLAGYLSALLWAEHTTRTLTTKDF